MNAPIALFVYNRPWHTKKTVDALKENKLAQKSKLFIFSDAPKEKKQAAEVRKVREYIKSISGFKDVAIFEHKENLGLAENIIHGVSKLVNEYGRVIVLEDDLVTSPWFLNFMNDALNMYQDEERVASVHGYVYPIENLPESFFIRGADCWGWATWKRAWDKFEKNGKVLLDEIQNRNIQKEIDFNHSYNFTQMLKDQIKGKNDSWAVRWYISTFLDGMLTLYPGQTYVLNIGIDGSGQHSKQNDVYRSKLNKNKKLKKINIEENKFAREKFEVFFRKINRGYLEKLFIKIKSFLLA